jgi:DNA primase
MDPDDLIRSGGAPAMQQVLNAARPMIDLIWQRETEGQVLDSPERRAALDRSLAAVLARIRDPAIRRHYGDEVRRLTRDLTRGPDRSAGRGRPPGAGRLPGPGRTMPDRPLATTRGSALARPGGLPVEERLQEAVLLATLAAHPDLIARFESGIAALDLLTPGHAGLRAALLRHAGVGDAEALRARLSDSERAALETLLSDSHVRSAPPARPSADPGLALMCVAEALARLEALRGMRREIADAAEDLSGLPDEGVTWRLGKAAEALRQSSQSSADPAGNTEEDRGALSRHLQDLIDREVWVKKRP